MSDNPVINVGTPDGLVQMDPKELLAMPKTALARFVAEKCWGAAEVAYLRAIVDETRKEILEQHFAGLKKRYLALHGQEYGAKQQRALQTVLPLVSQLKQALAELTDGHD